MTKEHWNKIEKPEECDCQAVEGDIVDYIDGLYCLCQCERDDVKDCNNIVVFSKDDSDVRHIKAMFKFIIELYDKGIRYIRVEGSKDRYKIMKKLFGNNMLLQVTPTLRDVYWCKLDDNVIVEMELLIKKEN